MRLSNQRYEEIKEMIADIYEDYDINSFPINVDSLSQKLNISFKFESQVKDRFSKKELPVFACALTDYSSMEHKVLIADKTSNEYRQNFSKCHEIGHLILGHKKAEAIEEAEANFFASYLLAPSCLVLVPEVGQYLIDNYWVIPFIFDISLDAAEVVYSRFIHRQSCEEKIKPYENRIIDILGESLINKIKQIMKNKKGGDQLIFDF